MTVVQPNPYLEVLVEISDTLDSAPDERASYVKAVEVLRRAIGAKLAPSFLLEETGTRAVLLTDEAQAAFFGERFSSLPAPIHVRDPWISPTGWPIQARDHLDSEGWSILPQDFRDWWGTSGVVVAVHGGGRHLGAVLMSFADDVDLTPEDEVFLAAAGHILGGAVYRWQVGQRQRELGALEERRWLADELHIDLSQQVAALGLRLGTMRLDLEEIDLAALREDMRQLEAMVGNLKQTLRHQMLGLRQDANLIEGSFLDLMRRHVDVYQNLIGIPVRLSCPQPDAAESLPLPVAAQLIRVLQEALANARLHSQATAVTIRLMVGRMAVRLEIEDNGHGFDPDVVPDAHLGLRIMHERMEQIGGTLSAGPGPDGGTLVVAEAPLSRATREVVSSLLVGSVA